MKRKWTTVACFLLSFLSTALGQKTRYGQDPVKPDGSKFPLHVHVSQSHIRYSCGGDNNSNVGKVKCNADLYADVVLDGKKLELWGEAVIGKIHFAVLAPGDYRAQITDEAHNAENTAKSSNYNILLPDGTVWHCALSGISE